MIPKIIHHVWPSDGDVIGEKFQRCIDSWHKFHPDWEFHIWRISNLPKDWVNPEVIDVANNPRLTVTIKSDIIRLEVLRIFGGIYADTDELNLKNIDDLLDKDFLCAWENNFSVGMSLVGCQANHPVVIEAQKQQFLNMQGKSAYELHKNILRITGPGMFTVICNKMDVDILPQHYFYLYNGQPEDKRSYTKHLVTSCDNDGWSKGNKFSSPYKLRIIIINKPVNDEVRKSIVAQPTSENRHFDIINGVFDPAVKKMMGIVKAKELAKKQALKYSDPYTIITDNDILQLNTNNFNDMIEFLESHKDYGAVALLREDNFFEGLNYDPEKNNHICNGCMMVRKEALKDLHFGRSSTKPTCWPMAKGLYKAGWKYGYLDSIPRIRHITL